MTSKITRILNPKKEPWEKFYLKTQNITNSKINANLPEWSKAYYKAYARMPSIQLPKPSTLTNQTLKNALKDRQSDRNFTNKSVLDIKHLSTLLYYSLGIITTDNKAEPQNLRRFYPSAGARYPIEAYVLVNNVNGLGKSIYHYYARNHLLEKLFSFSPKDLETIFTYQFPQDSSCIIVLTGVFMRTTMKYKNRGYNYTLMETGHIGQNIYLLSSALKIKCCALGGFVEKELSTLLDLNTEEESPLYSIALR